MKGKLKNDLILILALLTAAAAVWGVFRITAKKGACAVVLIDGTETARYPLDENIRVDIKTDGGHVNTLVIEDGRAFIESADCPDCLCVKQGRISEEGQSVICLPHKVVVRIEG